MLFKNLILNINIMLNITILILESNIALLYHIKTSQQGEEISIVQKSTWDPTTFLSDKTGVRLFEEITRRINVFWKKSDLKADYIIISLPGTLGSSIEVVSSSRLGVREPISLGSMIKKHTGIPCYLFHDTECLCTGELKYGDHIQGEVPSSLVYVFVDEGIGSKILINGKPYLGAGTAGLLGRLIVQPEGAFYPALKSNGSLEVYSSRPWVSRRLVELYNSELGKKEQTHLLNINNRSKFRLALSHASNNDWDQITYSRISDGLMDNDPIAINVIDNAAKYLGYALNALITLLNPSLIILGGSMVTEIPNFSDKTIVYSRQYSWANAWNGTQIEVSKHNRDIQVYGAVDLLINSLSR